MGTRTRFLRGMEMKLISYHFFLFFSNWHGNMHCTGFGLSIWWAYQSAVMKISGTAIKPERHRSDNVMQYTVSSARISLMLSESLCREWGKSWQCWAVFMRWKVLLLLRDSWETPLKTRNKFVKGHFYVVYGLPKTRFKVAASASCATLVQPST